MNTKEDRYTGAYSCCKKFNKEFYDEDDEWNLKQEKECEFNSCDDCPNYVANTEKKVYKEVNLTDFYWVDENNNKWRSNIYTGKEALLASCSLTNCKDCIDCGYSSNCNNCFFVQHSTDCNNCTKCTSCVRCEDCNECFECFDCVRCEFCSYLKKSTKVKASTPLCRRY